MSARSSRRSHGPRAIAALVAAALVTAPLQVGVAQPAGDRIARARALTDEGLARYHAGDGEAALVAFRAAYELVPANELLLDLGLAAEQARRTGEAIDYFERFLAVEPRDPRAPEVRARIATLHAAEAAAAARRREEAAARQAELDRAAEEARRRDAAWLAARERERRAADERAPGDRRDDARPPRGRGLRIAGLALAGGGAAALGVAAWSGLEARRLSDELSAKHAIYDPATVADGEAADRRMIIALCAGGALLGAGATLYLLGRRRGRTGGLAITPAGAVDGGGVGLVWRGSFE